MIGMIGRGNKEGDLATTEIELSASIFSSQERALALPLRPL